MSVWDDIPEAISVDLTTLSPEKRRELLSSMIDEDTARKIVSRIDGSASNYDDNMRRIDAIVGYLHLDLGGALKIAAVV